jgi:hypothetical protein
MSRDNPRWRQLYSVLKPTLKGESVLAGEAFTAVHGSTKWNYNTGHQWKLDMDAHLRRDYGLTSTTEVAYRLDPPDQKLPAGIKPHTIEGRIFGVLAAAAGEPVRPNKLIDEVWTEADSMGCPGSLYVGVSHLKAAGAGIVSTGCIFLRNYDRCEADSQPPSTFPRST